MATTEKAVNPLPDHGDHDRVVMLSLKADGTVADNRPEIIGDKDAAMAAAKEQFKQQAVSAADADYRRSDEDQAASAGKQDSFTEGLKKAHADAESKAEKAAEAAVNSLHQGE